MVEKPIGTIIHYFGNIKVGVIKLTGGALKVGDKIRVEGGEGEFDQVITSMQVDHKEIKSAKKGEEFGIKLDKKAHKGNKIYLVED